MAQPQTTWKLCVRNTFFHFELEKEDEKKLTRSASDSSLHSSLNSGSSSFSDASLNVNSSVVSGSSSLKARDQAAKPINNGEEEFFQSSESDSSRSNFDRCSTASRPLPGTDNMGNDWSKGSELHHLGKCDPCAFHTRSAGCTNGADCTFCHSCSAMALQKKRKANRKIEKRRGQEGKILMNL